MDDRFETYRALARKTASKIVLVVIDGLGGLPHPEFEHRTELEAAALPNLDRLARASACGLSTPIAPGITPGSGPSHLALFGYDPLRYDVGRGVLSALGIDFELTGGDVAARANFCTVDDEGRVLDRRGGRIPTEVCARLCARLSAIRMPGIEFYIRPEMDYRAALVLRGSSLDGRLTDSDPLEDGQPPQAVQPLVPESMRTAEIVNAFLEQARNTLRDEYPANMLLVRGFSQHEGFPSLSEIWRLDPACLAVYPMYRGVSRLVGMKVLYAGTTLEDQVKALEANWQSHDFFFLHVKKTDSAAKQGDFARKVEVLEAVDTLMPRLEALAPDVLAVTGDHCTPSLTRAHSWHGVPTLIWSERCLPDGVSAFDERSVAGGSLNGMRHVDLLPLLMANAGKLQQYGA
ncbi:MAG: 2,3-bisphosphoglycerate-independent phosphoglycerate mutase [Candidatus Eisenbacteria bacterium]